MGAPHAPPRRLGESLRALAGTLHEMLRVRGALFAVELAEEVERRKRMLALVAVAVAFLHHALLLVGIFVIVVFWDSHRLLAIGAVTLVYVGVGAAALWRLQQEIARSPPPFAATLSELDQDLAVLREP
jgi:uncharacterized membrane protein YqjE